MKRSRTHRFCISVYCCISYVTIRVGEKGIQGQTYRMISGPKNDAVFYQNDSYGLTIRQVVIFEGCRFEVEILFQTFILSYKMFFLYSYMLV